jgi:hypothetical protein
VADFVPNALPDARETAFESFGVRIGVATNDSGVWSRLAELLPPHSRPCDPGDVKQHFSVATNGDNTFTVRYDLRDGVAARPFDAASYVASDVDLELALGLLDTHVHGCVAFQAPKHIFIGAGAVAHHGRAILMPGPALCGKTTLVAALVRGGCVYYSDQYAVLDEQGCVHPYARPLSLSASVQSHRNHCGDTPAAVADATPVRVGAVVATSYRPGAEWRPKRLSRGEGVLALLSHTVPAQHRTGQVLRAINNALETGPLMVASERDDAEAVASLLLAELERELSPRV